MMERTKCCCAEIEELRRYKRQTEKLLKEKEHDLIILGRRCETLMLMLKRYIGEEKT